MNISILQNQKNQNISMEETTKYKDADVSKLGTIVNEGIMDQNVIALPIVNAGLVLLQGYMETLFDRLGLTSDDDFSSESARHKAIHYLQYIVTGQKGANDNDVVLNKVLCGFSLTKSVEKTDDYTERDMQTMESLIKAMINYWPTNGSSSIDGFRGNWLIRDGILSEKEDRWDLVVEKKAYDILLRQSPISFSIIKNKSMTKPLYVTWDY